MKKILVVGSINMDCVIRLPRRPRPGETVFCSTVSHVPGGKGANQAYALGRMGTGVSLIGAVGQDEFGRISLANLRAAGVDTTGVRVSADEDTGRAFIEVEDDGQNSIIVLGGANTHVTEQDLLAHEALFDRCEALIMQLETPLDTVTAAARLARRKGKLVLLDPAPARPDLPAELLQCVDLLKPNETELEIVSGLPADTREQCIAAARSLLDRGVGQVLVTLGARGSLLVTRDGELFVPARKVKAPSPAGWNAARMPPGNLPAAWPAPTTAKPWNSPPPRQPSPSPGPAPSRPFPRGPRWNAASPHQPTLHNVETKESVAHHV